MKKILLNDNFIISLIVLNGLVLFVDSFDWVQTNVPWLDKLDLFISLIFILEMSVKIRTLSFNKYIDNNWNKLDFAVNLLLIPSFVLFFIGEANLMFLTILRLVRIFKFFRFLRFVPNIDHLMTGIGRAMKASVFVFVSFFLYLFIISVLSCFFFKEVSPEHFGNPLLSLYSTFKIFTIEGWYELPELIADKHGMVAAFFVKMYFIFLVLTGGIFGIGLVNAVFVDELVSDNNDEVLKKISDLHQEIKDLKDLINKK